MQQQILGINLTTTCTENAEVPLNEEENKGRHGKPVSYKRILMACMNLNEDFVCFMGGFLNQDPIKVMRLSGTCEHEWISDIKKLFLKHFRCGCILKKYLTMDLRERHLWL